MITAARFLNMSCAICSRTDSAHPIWARLPHPPRQATLYIAMPRPERSFRTEAIILRRQDLGEADRLLTLYTPEFGKLSVVAKGVRKPNGRNTGHVEMFARSSMLLARGRELHVVNQADMTESFLPIREDLARAAYASYVIELLDRFTEPEEQNTPLYRLLNDALGWLTDMGYDLRLAARFYELSLLRLVGYQPDFFQCVAGFEDIEPQDQFFSAAEGGLMCPEHAEGNPGVLAISLSALKTLRYLQTRDFEVIRILKLSEGCHIEIERIIQHYIVYLLERRLKSVDFIHHLQHQALSGGAFANQ
jgi:DNA repair protein RecO (recombination protein O)